MSVLCIDRINLGQKYGLDEKECLNNIRLLSLCSLAIEHEEIPYRVVSSCGERKVLGSVTLTNRSWRR